ncbi:MAG: tRNA (N6-threonylcarbamoyladenosine(37)-N6)-methyltransferase TrmO [Nitrospirae bacterium RBG_13_39_12]|nr:MAG: tRNA (N6-threonylcarbamoyladenosine(37)-N6)-methyltransferase TrmO [Nitrospirae bacterium RBG_13_39_12]
MKIELEPIGIVRTNIKNVPRHWTVSDAKGMLVIDKKYTVGLKDIRPGQRIIIIFHFHQSPGFTQDFMIQTPPHRKENLGVFSTCSPIRPNPVGMSVLEVVSIENNIIHIKGLDMLDGTPIIDIKPMIENCTKEIQSRR